LRASAFGAINDRIRSVAQPLSQATINKVLRRLIPFAVLCYLLNYMDRVNVSIAKLAMARDIPGFTDNVYAHGTAIFFVGYCLFELPSNLIQQRVGARRWIARIMISWGLISLCFIGTAGPRSFYGLRLLLGVAEAGFFPGMILYLSQWVPHIYRARASAWFLTSIALSGTLGNPVGGCILYLSEKHPFLLRSWQWLFLLEGVPTVLLGLMALFFLTDRPSDARWLSEDERRALTDELARERRAHPAQHAADFKHALASPYTWLLSGLYCLVIFGFYTLNYYTPTILKQTLLAAGILTEQTPVHRGYLYIGLCSAIPFGVAAVGMVLLARHSDRCNERKLHVAFACACEAAGLALAATATALPSTAGTVLMIAGLSLAAIGAFGLFGPFWALPPQFMTGTAAVAAFAIINSIGNLAGGYLGTEMHAYMSIRRHLLLAAGLSVLATVLALALRIPAHRKAPVPAAATAGRQ
jgi:ACS family tartrate transporter-like MFS transporter